MKTPSILILRNTSRLSKAIMAPGHHTYLERISRSGRSSYWTADQTKALRMTRARWTDMQRRYPSQCVGRLVLPPVG